MSERQSVFGILISSINLFHASVSFKYTGGMYMGTNSVIMPEGDVEFI